jgi:hypothetical protein
VIAVVGVFVVARYIFKGRGIVGKEVSNLRNPEEGPRTVPLGLGLYIHRWLVQDRTTERPLPTPVTPGLEAGRA